VSAGEFTALDPWDLKEPVFVDCRRPHSFYDFVAWCTNGTSASLPVSRICNIMRKRQHTHSGSGEDSPLTVVAETLRAGTPGSNVDDRLISEYLKDDVASSLLRVSLFLGEVKTVGDVRPGLQDAYQGYFILKKVTPAKAKPFGHVFEAVIHASAGLLNNYVHAQGSFPQQVCGCNFTVRGSYFAQQNALTTVCAHDSLLSALMNLPNGPSETAVREQLHAALTPPPNAGGPKLHQMVDALGRLGIACKVQDLEGARQPEDYRGLVYATIESGYPAIIIFTTANAKERHAITVVGHTLNSDTWFPEVEFGYGHGSPGPKFHPTYDWAPHWLVNDGNLGMYFCLEAGRMRLGPEAAAPAEAPFRAGREPLKAVAVIGLYENDPEIVIANAEIKVAYLLDVFAQTLLDQVVEPTDAEARWLRRLVDTCRAGNFSPGPILRTFQTDREKYLAHMFGEPDWNNNTFLPEERKALTKSLLQVLPNKVWVTEFTLVNLYTANRRKLGEVVYTGRWSNTNAILGEGLCFVRAPGIAWFPTIPQVAGTSVTSHTGIMRPLATSIGQPEY